MIGGKFNGKNKTEQALRDVVELFDVDCKLLRSGALHIVETLFVSAAMAARKKKRLKIIITL